MVNKYPHKAVAVNYIQITKPRVTECLQVDYKIEEAKIFEFAAIVHSEISRFLEKLKRKLCNIRLVAAAWNIELVRLVS